VRIDLLKNLARNGNVFTTAEFVRASGMQKGSAADLLGRFEKNGLVERFGKAKYMIIPLSSEKGKFTLHEFVIGSFLADPYCVGYWSALNFHGLTEQIPTTVFIQTTSRKKKQKQEVFGVNYQFVRLKQKKFMGITERWFDRYRVKITDPEKTIVDCLDKPQYCGGVIEVAKALNAEKARQKVDTVKMVDYAGKLGNSGVTRRLGYLCQMIEVDIDIPRPQTRNYLYLDPTMPKEGERIAKWRLINNLGRDIMGDLE